VKRYVAEDGSETVRDAMAQASGWFICRVGFVETVRATTLAAGDTAASHFREEWSAFGVIELDQRLAQEASKLAVEHDLRSLDALHLAAALVLPSETLTVATWDHRLHAAAASAGLPVTPPALP
jgi:predicted nucleic acid-binding protein